MQVSQEGLMKGFRIQDPKVLECFRKGNLTREEAELLATVSGYDYSKEKEFLVDAIINTDEETKTIYPPSIVKDIVVKWPHPIAVVAGQINNVHILNQVKFRNLWKRKVHVIKDAGYAVQIHKADEFNRLVCEFLNDVFVLEEN